MMRTHLAGAISPALRGEPVVVCGWVASRRDHGGVVFLDIRDVGGIVQVVIDPETTTGADPHAIRAEYVLRVEGVVRDRPEGTVNTDLPTGALEVAAATVEILNAAEPSPIPIDDRVEADEMLRLKYRYLDLRGRRLQANLRLRARLQRVGAHHHGRARVPGGRDAHAHRVDSRGCPRLRRAESALAGELLRAAAEPAALQAAADGRRHRPLLPDRPVPPRRGSARGPSVRVHAARRGDELRGCRRRDGCHRRGGRQRDRGRHRGRRSGDRAPHLARGHGTLRERQARSPVRAGTRRRHRGLRGDRVPSVPGRGGEGASCPGPGRPRPIASRCADRARRSSSGPPAWCGCGSRSTACSKHPSQSSCRRRS